MTGISGAVSGLTNQTISGVTANPSFPASSYSPDGSFIYDNLYSSTGMAFDYSGLLFTTAGEPERLLEPLGELARRLFALRVGWQLQLPDPGERNSERRRGHAGTVDLGDAGNGLRSPLLRWPVASARRASPQPRLDASSLKQERAAVNAALFLAALGAASEVARKEN